MTIKSQNTENEQQNNLCTTLTEQWKKGKLEIGQYYIKYKGVYISDKWYGNCWKHGWNEYVEEVLAPVPSYEEWQQLHKFLEEFNTLDVAEENKKLKGLLKECRAIIYENILGEYVIELCERITNAIGEK